MNPDGYPDIPIEPDPQLTQRAAQVPGWEGSIGPFPAQYGRPHCYARSVHSGAGNCVCGRARGDALHVRDDAPLNAYAELREERSRLAEVEAERDYLRDERELHQKALAAAHEAVKELFDLRARLAKTERERDSLARRCAIRFEVSERFGAAVAELHKRLAAAESTELRDQLIAVTKQLHHERRARFDLEQAFAHLVNELRTELAAAKAKAANDG